MDWKSILPGYDAYYNLSIGSFPDRGCHLIEWIAKMGGLITEGTLPNPYLNFLHAPPVFDETGILVHPWVPFVERQWWELMNLKSSYCGHKVYSIGCLDERMVPNTEDLRGIDFLLYIDRIRTARLVVGLCSFPVALAASLGVPAIMVHRITDPQNAGIQRFGPQKLDLVRPRVYNVESAINELLGMQYSNERGA